MIVNNSMKLTLERMQESGTIDYVTLLGAVEKIKRALDASRDYAVLLFDNAYFIVYYDYAEHVCPSRYTLLANSDFVFRIVYNEVEIIKSKLAMEDARDIFETCGIHVFRTCSMVHIDEE